MTKDNWIKAFENTRLVKMGGMCFECCDYEDMVDDMKAFISQVEKDAEERGYQLGLRDGIKKEHEKSESWTELNKQGVINTHKLIKDAIEKTNKRWRERIGEKAEKRLWTNTVANNMHVVKKYHQGINDLVSDLLEDK